jgi:hypothetical protein
MRKDPEFVMPAEAAIQVVNSMIELLDARLCGHDILATGYSHSHWSGSKLLWTVLIKYKTAKRRMAFFYSFVDI